MKAYLKNIFVILFLLGGTAVYSAPGRPPPPPGGGGASCWPPPCMPIDNGVIFLIAVAGLYGAKKLYDFRKKAEA